MYNFIETAIDNNILIAMFVTELFTYDHIITEMLMTVPLITFETAIAGLVNASVKQLFKHEQDTIDEYCNTLFKEEDSQDYALRDDYQTILETRLEIDTTKITQNKWTKGEYEVDINAPISTTMTRQLKSIAKDSDFEEADEDEGEEEEEESEEEIDDNAVEYVTEGDSKAKERLANPQQVYLYLKK